MLAAGALDLSFDGDGKVLTHISQDTALDVAAYQSDGKVIAVGHTIVDLDQVPQGHVAVARYNSDGSLDGGFGVNGVQIIDLGGNALARAVAVDSQGRVVVAGDSDDDIAVMRLTSEGVLDSDFGIGGVQLVDFDGRNDDGVDVVVDSQDRVIIAGTSYEAGFVADFAVARLTEAGNLDADFASGGKLLIDLGSEDDIGNTVAVDASNRVIISGYTSNGAEFDFAVVRLLESGIPDAEFATDGVQTVDFGGSNDVGVDLAIDGQGRLLLSGHRSQAGASADFAIARLTAAGELDANFGVGGTQTVDFGDTPDIGLEVAIDSQQRLVIAGYSVQPETAADFAVVRLTSTGDIDADFGLNGRQTVDFGGASDVGQAVAVDGQDRVILLGFSDQGANLRDFALARLLGGDLVMEATIDIEPHSESNSINPGSQGITEVAILSTSAFDARQVDPATLTFGRTGDEASLSLHKKKGARIKIEDVNGDGQPDLVAAFETELTGLQATDSEGVLRGRTLAGQAFEGRDMVQIVGKGKRRNGSPSATPAFVTGEPWSRSTASEGAGVSDLESLADTNSKQHSYDGFLPLLVERRYTAASARAPSAGSSLRNDWTDLLDAVYGANEDWLP